MGSAVRGARHTPGRDGCPPGAAVGDTWSGVLPRAGAPWRRSPVSPQVRSLERPLGRPEPARPVPACPDVPALSFAGLRPRATAPPRRRRRPEPARPRRQFLRRRRRRPGRLRMPKGRRLRPDHLVTIHEHVPYRDPSIHQTLVPGVCTNGTVPPSPVARRDRYRWRVIRPCPGRAPAATEVAGEGPAEWGGVGVPGAWLSRASTTWRGSARPRPPRRSRPCSWGSRSRWPGIR